MCKYAFSWPPSSEPVFYFFSVFLPAGLFHSTDNFINTHWTSETTSYPGSPIPIFFPHLTMATMDNLISLKKKSSRKEKLTMLSNAKAIHHHCLPGRWRPSIGVGISKLVPQPHSALTPTPALPGLSMDPLVAVSRPLFLKDSLPRNPLTYPTSPPNSHELRSKKQI